MHWVIRHWAAVWLWVTLHATLHRTFAITVFFHACFKDGTASEH